MYQVTLFPGWLGTKGSLLPVRLFRMKSLLLEKSEGPCQEPSLDFSAMISDRAVCGFNAEGLCER